MELDTRGELIVLGVSMAGTAIASLFFLTEYTSESILTGIVVGGILGIFVGMFAMMAIDPDDGGTGHGP